MKKTREMLIVTVEAATRRSAIIFALVGPTLLWSGGNCFAQDEMTTPQYIEQSRIIDMTGISSWLSARFSQGELEALHPGELKIEAHYCSCYDRPRKHFPYAVVLVTTPKGDWVARPEGGDAMMRFTALAVRFGNLYCEIGSEGTCYGSFLQPCDFTDFRYGPYLAPYFPTCKADETETSALVLEDSTNFGP